MEDSDGKEENEKQTCRNTEHQAGAVGTGDCDMCSTPFIRKNGRLYPNQGQSDAWKK